MQRFSNADGQVVVEEVCRAIQDNKDYLSEIDGLIGDGDHGINMNKGFTMCLNEIDGQHIGFAQALKALGGVLLDDIGGSMGPLYGTLFRKMFRRAKNEAYIDRDVFGDMLHDAVTGVAELGGAQLGDKTLMDVLIPADVAYQQAIAGDKDFSGALADMKAAAEAGWLSTKDMVAKLGRASRLGERSRGVLDAGATSCNLVLSTMADAIKALI